MISSKVTLLTSLDHKQLVAIWKVGKVNLGRVSLEIPYTKKFS